MTTEDVTTKEETMREASAMAANDANAPMRNARPVTTVGERAEGVRPPKPAVGEPVYRRFAAQDGSLVTEYGLLAVIAATIAGVVMQWASQGALVSLFNALLSEARSLVGA